MPAEGKRLFLNVTRIFDLVCAYFLRLRTTGLCFVRRILCEVRSGSVSVADIEFM